MRFRRDEVQLERQGNFHWGVLSGMQAGSAERIGSLYWLRRLCPDTDAERIVGDCLGSSFPYGVYAPAELYDMEALQRRRSDHGYYTALAASATGAVSILPPCNILQMHVRTASPNGYVSGLTALYRELGRKLRCGEPLTPAETNLLGYDAVQLLPIEPTVEVRSQLAEDDFFSVLSEGEDVQVRLRRPDLQNWGYDVVLFGSAAINPALLETLRPDELVAFIAELHNFPTGPIRVIYDIVYGHADNQAVHLLNGPFLKGPSMYGQDVNHQNPVVRAILLEMQRRKVNTGADGIRIDGGQDFRYFDPMTARLTYDDPYLLAMADQVQDIGEIRWRPFVIFEDGRPWPAEGWEESSSYRDLVELRPDAFQWGPIIFAHNTPALQGFWAGKWPRVCEKMQYGSRWVTGCGNHDTLRRGTQIDPAGPINPHLGSTLAEVLANAYDNPAVGALTYGFSPGMPMDFLQCLMRAPWGFFRNTDDCYGVKVVAEEAPGFLDWQLTAELYADPGLFRATKQLGFGTLTQLRHFLALLADAITASDYDLDQIAEACQIGLPSGVDAVVDVAWLKVFARHFMEDMHADCNVWRHADRVDRVQADFNLTLRQFRRSRPWLAKNLGSDDRLDLITTPATTIFHGLRRPPAVAECRFAPRADSSAEGAEPGVEAQPDLSAVALVSHMGGEAMTLGLPELFPFQAGRWRLLLASPGMVCTPAQLAGDKPITLRDSQALLLAPIELQR